MREGRAQQRQAILARNRVPKLAECDPLTGALIRASKQTAIRTDARNAFGTTERRKNHTRGTTTDAGYAARSVPTGGRAGIVLLIAISSSAC